MIANFQFTSSLSDDGSNWGTMLRYANESKGFRVAAGIGYEHYGQVPALQNCVSTNIACVNPPGFGPANQATPAPSGLFVQGHYIHVDYDENAPTTLDTLAFWGQYAQGRIPADQWLLQGGITRDWSGLGNTSVFAEYSRNNGWGAGGGPFAPNGETYSAALTPGARTVFGVSDTEVTMYGFGIQQNLKGSPIGEIPTGIDFYLDARHFSADVTCSATGANCTGAAAVIGSVPLQKLQTDGFWVFIGGTRMRF